MCLIVITLYCVTYLMKHLKNNIFYRYCTGAGSWVLLFLLFFAHSDFLFSQKIDTVDIQKPMFNKAAYCGDYIINVTDNLKYTINKDSFQLDEGVIVEPLFYKTLSENFTDIYSSTFQNGKVNNEFSFRLSVLNKFENAKAVFGVVDATNLNFRADSLIYRAEKLQITPGALTFGSVFVNTVSELSAQILNTSDTAIRIKSISLKYGKLYSLVNAPQSYELALTESLKLIVHYKPDTDNFNNSGMDIDSLIVETNCLRYVIPITGNGVKAGIIVDDVDFGAVEVGTMVCYNENYNPDYGKGLRISNPGSGRLLTHGYYPLSGVSPFKLNQPTVPDINTLEINPKAEKYITGLCFEPIAVGEFFDTLVIKNNAEGPDSTCNIRGIAYLPGPYLTSINIGRVRLGDKKKGVIYLRNSGSEPVEIVDLYLNTSTDEFRILIDETVPFINPQNPAVIYPNLPQFQGELREIAIMVEFSPKIEFLREIKIIPAFKTGSKYETGSVFNYVRGFGFKPAISAEGHIFSGKILVNNQHPDTGRVIIKSTSWSSDLHLKSIELMPLGNTQKGEFKFLREMPKDTSISIVKDLELPVVFKPMEAGDRELMLRIISDSYKGIDKSRWDTVFAYIKGIGYNKVLSVEPLIFDSVFHCQTSKGILKIRNISDTAEAFIMKLIPISGDINAFTLNTDSIDNNFIILKPSDSLLVEVTFDPTAFTKNQFELYVRVFSDADTSTGLIKATTVRKKVLVSLPVIDDVMPGEILQYNPPKSFGPDFDIFADFSSLTSIDVLSYDIEIKYNKKKLKFVNLIRQGDLTLDWENLSANEIDVGNDFAILRISGSGSKSLSGLKGSICKPAFVVLLGDSNEIDIEIQKVSFANADYCIDIIKSNGKLKMSYCGNEVRKIVISKHPYNIQNISMNPVTGSSAVISYSIALDAYAKIEIFNSYGVSVGKIADSFIPKGEYFYNLDTSELGSGTYFIQMVSGPFSKTIKIMVAK